MNNHIYILFFVLLILSCSPGSKDKEGVMEDEASIATSVGNLALGSRNISDEELIENRKLVDWIVNGQINM